MAQRATSLSPSGSRHVFMLLPLSLPCSYPFHLSSVRPHAGATLLASFFLSSPADVREAMMKANDKAAAQAGACVAEKEPKREEWTRRKRLGEIFFSKKKKKKGPNTIYVARKIDKRWRDEGNKMEETAINRGSFQDSTLKLSRQMNKQN